jgi:hypothetical protein
VTESVIVIIAYPLIAQAAAAIVRATPGCLSRGGRLADESVHLGREARHFGPEPLRDNGN